MELTYLLYYCKKGKAIIWVVDLLKEKKVVYKIKRLDERFANVEIISKESNTNENFKIEWGDLERKIKNKEWAIGSFQNL